MRLIRRIPFISTLIMFIFLAMMTACNSGMGSGAYYSVTLDNNIVFFGQLKDQDSQNITLKNIYYLQRVIPQGGADKDAQLRLIRQSNDFIGPEDELVINRSHLLLYQKLRKDSQIVQEIKRQEDLAKEEKEPKVGETSPEAAPQFRLPTKPRFYLEPKTETEAPSKP